MNNTMRVVIIVVVVVAAAGAFYMKDRSSESTPQPVPQESPGAAPAQAKPAEAAANVAPEKSKAQLVCFGADRCVPCRMMVPVRKALAEAYPETLSIEFVDVWKDRAAGQRNNIRVIPTALFIDAAGKELYRQEGFMDKETIEAKFKELGVDLAASAGDAP